MLHRYQTILYSFLEILNELCCNLMETMFCYLENIILLSSRKQMKLTVVINCMNV